MSNLAFSTQRMEITAFSSKLRANAPEGRKAISYQLYFGLGVVVIDGWILQTPSFHGYYGLMAYQSGSDIAIAVYCTKEETADIDSSPNRVAFEKLSLILAPRKDLPDTPQETP